MIRFFSFYFFVSFEGTDANSVYVSKSFSLSPLTHKYTLECLFNKTQLLSYSNHYHYCCLSAHPYMTKWMELFQIDRMLIHTILFKISCLVAVFAMFIYFFCFNLSKDGPSLDTIFHRHYQTTEHTYIHKHMWRVGN